MSTYKKISSDAFEKLVLDAGVVLTTFDPTAPAAPADSAIICATSGGVTASCIPSYSDFADGVDNAGKNLKEFKHLDSWECKLGFTTVTADAATIKLALGAADISGDKITPRKDLAASDFTDEIWWVGDKGDGGAVAIKLANVLSTGGFSLKSENNGKGSFTVELTGHVSANAQSVVPMEFYVIDAED